jgi:hypothetical protein
VNTFAALPCEIFTPLIYDLDFNLHLFSSFRDRLVRFDPSSLEVRCDGELPPSYHAEGARSLESDKAVFELPATDGLDHEPPIDRA